MSGILKTALATALVAGTLSFTAIPQADASRMCGTRDSVTSLLCRKSQEEEGQYYDIAMLGTNPYTG
ncbi:MAG: hypothetical protein AAF638_10585, partial [Pseudomonadota bacterium]